MSVNAEALVVHRDPRGFVFEPVTPSELSEYASIHVVVNEPGAVRGNHVHRHVVECLIVEGPSLVRFRDGAGVHDVQVSDGEVVRFRIPPGVSHAVQNTGARPRVIVVLGTGARDDHAPDVAPDLLVAPAHHPR